MKEDETGLSKTTNVKVSLGMYGREEEKEEREWNEMPRSQGA